MSHVLLDFLRCLKPGEVLELAPDWRNRQLLIRVLVRSGNQVIAESCSSATEVELAASISPDGAIAHLAMEAASDLRELQQLNESIAKEKTYVQETSAPGNNAGPFCGGAADSGPPSSD